MTSSQSHCESPGKLCPAISWQTFSTDSKCTRRAGDGRLRLRAPVPEGSGLYAGAVRSMSPNGDAAELSGERYRPSHGGWHGQHTLRRPWRLDSCQCKDDC